MESKRTVLFELWVVGQRLAFRAARTDDGRVVLSQIDDGDRHDLVVLPREQAAKLALELLAADPDALSTMAERLPDEVAAELGVRLLAPAAARSLARKADESGTAH